MIDTTELESEESITAGEHTDRYPYGSGVSCYSQGMVFRNTALLGRENGYAEIGPSRRPEDGFVVHSVVLNIHPYIQTSLSSHRVMIQQTKAQSNGYHCDLTTETGI